MGWIVTSDQSGRDRVLEVTRTVLTELQAAVIQTTSTSWPSDERGVGPPEPHAEIAGDGAAFTGARPFSGDRHRVRGY